MMFPVDLCTSLWPRVGVAFDRPKIDSLCHFSAFICMDKTLNV